MQLFLAVALGALYLLAGYRTIRFTSKIESAALLLCLALLAGRPLDNGWLLAAIGVAAAVAGYLLGNAYYFVNMAVLGALLGVVLMGISAGSIGWDSGAASALLGGMLACRFQRPIVIFATSVIGALLLTMASLAPSAFLMTGPRASWSQAATAVGLTILGCVVQARSTRPKPTALQNR